MSPSQTCKRKKIVCKYGLWPLENIWKELSLIISDKDKSTLDCFRQVDDLSSSESEKLSERGKKPKKKARFGSFYTNPISIVATYAPCTLKIQLLVQM